jgi:peptidoglycan/LPS O-acetylase OafA/YrhL
MMSSSYSEFRARRTFAGLDGLRAIAVLGPVWHHTARGEPLLLADMGARGVPLFFAISGFLITTLLLREKERTGTIDLKAFFVRRALRIFPLYYVVLLLYVALVWAKDRDNEAGQQFFRNLPFFVTYTSNWFVALEGRTIFYFVWSLATEEQFYLVWPSLERFSPKWLPAAVAGALSVVWLALDVGWLPLAGFVRTVLLSVPPAITFGVILAHVLHSPRGFGIVGKILGRPWASAVLAVAVVGELLLELHVWPMSLTMALWVGAVVVPPSHLLSGVLSVAPLVRLGTVSYGVYLLHMLVLNVMERVVSRVGIDSRLAVYGATVVATLGVATVSFHFFEQRFLKLKERWVR